MDPKDFESVKMDPITLTKDNTHPTKSMSLKQLSDDFENIDSAIKDLVLRVIAESETPISRNPPEQQSTGQPPIPPTAGDA